MPRGSNRPPSWTEAIGGTEFLAALTGDTGHCPRCGNHPGTSTEPATDGPVAPRVAISLGLAGTIRRVVFGPDSHILDFGDDVDYFHGPLREAVIIRDRFCRDEGCGLPGRDCQIDHVIPRSKGGPTAETNAQCQCGTSNRLKGDRMP